MSQQFTVATLAALLLAACATPPRTTSEALPPKQVLDFTALFSENCTGCHGENGRGGAAIGLADPIYLTIVDEASMRKTIANGVRGTAMPAFAESAGGLLTDQQIEVIVREIRSQWSRPGVLGDVVPPSYIAKSEGDASRGSGVYKTYCESCHGTDGAGTAIGSAITNDSFLALVSDQGLRTLVIAGRPELGGPGWRGSGYGRPMSEQEVSDVVAWLISRRAAVPGRPY
jgi:mono/diheme cytochrome c family protein